MRIQIPNRNAQVLECSHGLIFRKPLKAREWVIPSRSKRGKITTFSRSSAKNLRDKLIQIPDKVGVYGVTLTLQKDKYFEHDVEYFRNFWLSFSQAVKRAVRKGDLTEHLYLLWRIELTQNRVPHFHVILSTYSPKDIAVYCGLWVKMVKKHYNYTPIASVAVNIRAIDSYEEAYAYVCAHSSKHKRSQLGWQGRQWGMQFASAKAKKYYQDSMSTEFKDVDKTGVAECKLWNTLDEKTYFAIKRVLRKMFYSKLRSNGIFSCLKPDRHKLCRVSSRYLAMRQSSQSSHFVCEDTKLKVMEYYNVG